MRNAGAQLNRITVGRNQVLELPPGRYFSDPNGDAMRFDAAAAPPDARGRLAFDATTGAARFMPKRSAVGVAALSLRATDSAGLTAADAAAFEVTVSEPRARAGGGAGGRGGAGACM